MTASAAILWIVGSALVGYLGRNKFVGFWGFFFFSLLFSPVLAGLALFVSGPSAVERRRAEAERRARIVAAQQAQGVNVIMNGAGTAGAIGARTVTVTSPAMSAAGAVGAASTAVAVPSYARTAIRGFIVMWLITVIAFAAAYWILSGRSTANLLAASALSLEVGTFTATPLASAAPGARQDAFTEQLRVAMVLERIVVVCLLVILLLRLATRNHAALASELKLANEEHAMMLTTMKSAIGEVKDLSKRSLDRLDMLEQRHDDVIRAATTAAATTATAVAAATTAPPGTTTTATVQTDEMAVAGP